MLPKVVIRNIPKILHFKAFDLVTSPLSFITFKLVDKISNQIDITAMALAARTFPKFNDPVSTGVSGLSQMPKSLLKTWRLEVDRKSHHY